MSGFARKTLLIWLVVLLFGLICAAELWLRFGGGADYYVHTQRRAEASTHGAASYIPAHDRID